MLFKKAKFHFANPRGFTMVELLMVMGIMGMLAAIGVQQVKFNRENAYDRQAQATMRNLLTCAAVDEPDPPAGEENQNGVSGGFAVYGYTEVELPGNVYWKVLNDGQDRWRFWFAHPGGQTGFYFWIPGEAYSGSLDDDGAAPPNRSDKIVYNATYRTDAGL